MNWRLIGLAVLLVAGSSDDAPTCWASQQWGSRWSGGTVMTCMTPAQMTEHGMVKQKLPDGETCFALPNDVEVCRK